MVSQDPSNTDNLGFSWKPSDGLKPSNRSCSSEVKIGINIWPWTPRKQNAVILLILCHSLLLWCIKLCMPSCDIHGSMAFLLVSLDHPLPTCSLHGGQGWVAAVVGGLGGWSVSKKFQGTSRLTGHWIYLLGKYCNWHFSITSCS